MALFVNLPLQEPGEITEKDGQIAPSNNIALAAGEIRDDLREWFAIYFATQVTTSPRSQKEQRRDLALFLTFLRQEFGNTLRTTWSPRASGDFLMALQNTVKVDGTKKWSDRTVNRMTAHLKTFAKWIHQHRSAAAGRRQVPRPSPARRG